MKIQKIKNLYFGTSLILSINSFWLAYAEAFPNVNKISDTTVDSQAMTLSSDPYGYAINGLSFQQDAVITHNGWQYVTYYNDDRHVCVARRDLPLGSWEKIVLDDYTLSTTTDAHNVISMGICLNDGTIHLAFDHHTSTLHYRVSQIGVATDPNAITWSASLFGPVHNYLEVGKSVSGLTYPRFWQTPAGDLQMSYRYGGSGNGDMILVDYDGIAGQWHHTREVISRDGYYSDSLGSSTSRNAYMNSFGYGPYGKLHGTWCWRETAGGANHDIMYAYSSDGGYVWLSNAGEGESIPFSLITNRQGVELQVLLSLKLTSPDNVIGRATGDPETELLIDVDSPEVSVVELDRYYGLMNTQAQDTDPQGRIHTVMWHCTDETYQEYPRNGLTWGPQGARKYYHYWRDTLGVWHRNDLPGYVGTRPKLFIRSNGDAFLIYQSRQAEDENPTSGEVRFIEGNLTIQAATAAAQWTDWEIIHVETGPFLNEMLGDLYRFKQEEILSVLVQEIPQQTGQPSPLRIIDFNCL